MENSNLDETRAIHTGPNSGEKEGFDETIRMQLNQKSGDQAGDRESIDQTAPIPMIHNGEGVTASPSGFEETMPLAIGQGPGDQADGVDHLSSSADSGTAHTALQDQLILAASPEKGDEPTGGTPAKGRRPTWPMITVLGVITLILIAAVSAFAGYRSGIEMRVGAQATQAVQIAQEQFDLGIQDMDQGQYQRARQRFEYVIRIDPGFPGVTEKLADVLLELNTTATPTIMPTPTLTPTPDMRGVQELFDQGQQYLLNSDWSKAIDTLLLSRKSDPNFKAVEIDGMLFMALRNRGMDKIGKQADLEGGIYDLTLAERFGPLDAEAQGYLNWASLYIKGASFWDLDWEQAVYYFGQIAPQLPYLRDGSKMTASERYRIALIGYGDTLASKKQWCEAQIQYELSLSIAPDDKAQQALKDVAQRCSPPQATPPPGDQNPPPDGGQPTGGPPLP